MVFKWNDNKQDFLSILSMVFRGLTFGYIAQGNLNIGTHRDITGEITIDKL